MVVPSWTRVSQPLVRSNVTVRAGPYPCFLRIGHRGGQPDDARRTRRVVHVQDGTVVSDEAVA